MNKNHSRLGVLARIMLRAQVRAHSRYSQHPVPYRLRLFNRQFQSRYPCNQAICVHNTSIAASEASENSRVMLGYGEICSEA